MHYLFDLVKDIDHSLAMWSYNALGIVYVKWTPLCSESPTLDTLPLALNLKEECTWWIYDIKPQCYKVTHWMFLIYKRCEQMKICNSIFIGLPASIHYGC
jgi:hypothetical protein